VKRKKVELYKTVDLRWRAFCLRNMDERFHHPFTCVVAGPTSCGKNEFVAKFILQYMQIMKWTKKSRKKKIFALGVRQPVTG